MGFTNPILGGGGALVYPSIHSPNFVTGVSGWTVKKDGSAEFNNLTVRGTFDGTDYVINTNGAFFYSGTPALGNLIGSDAASPGTDAEGNAYLAGKVGYFQSGGAFAATQIGTVQQVGFYSAAAAGGPWVQVGSIQAGSGDVELASNRDIVAQQPVGLPDASAPTALTGRSRLYSASGHAKYASTDGNVYNTGATRYWLTASSPTINVASTAPKTITFAEPTSTANIPVGQQSYLIRGMIVVQQGATTANQAVSLTGPGTSLVSLSWFCTEGGSVLSSGNRTGLGTASSLTTGSVPNGTTGELHFDGIVTFSGTGNLNLIAWCVTSTSDTWTLGPGSYVEVCPIS